MSDDWRKRAACLEDSYLFHVPDGERTESPAAAARIRDAKKACATCPVHDDCLDWAITTHDGHGIAGGLTPDERTNLIRRQKREARAEHGTLAGYRSHYRRGEPPCEECREAERTYKRDRYAATRRVIDEVAIARGIDGHADTLSRKERTEVVRALAERGLSDAQIAPRVVRTKRQVCRIRAAAGIESRWAT